MSSEYHGPMEEIYADAVRIDPIEIDLASIDPDRKEEYETIAMKLNLVRVQDTAGEIMHVATTPFGRRQVRLATVNFKTSVLFQFEHLGQNQTIGLEIPFNKEEITRHGSSISKKVPAFNVDLWARERKEVY